MDRVRKQLEDVAEDFMTDGSGVTVAVLDTGIALHPDLIGRVVCFRDFVEGRNRPYDDNGHGTHVSGIICGDGRLSGGRYRGIAPGARLVVGKVLDENGDGCTEHMLNALDWVLAEREKYGIRIVNISVGIGSMDKKKKEQALKDKIEQLWEEGIVVVCAAGNKGPADGSLACVGGSMRIITVGCHDGEYYRKEPGRCESYSGRGIAGAKIRKPDVVAPGTNIVSCNYAFIPPRLWRKECGAEGERKEILRMGKNAYVAKSGTSMATPIVSGAVALTLQKYPSMTNDECRQKLQYTATDLGIPWNQQGWGMINIRRLLE